MEPIEITHDSPSMYGPPDYSISFLNEENTFCSVSAPRSVASSFERFNISSTTSLWVIGNVKGFMYSTIAAEVFPRV